MKEEALSNDGEPVFFGVASVVRIVLRFTPITKRIVEVVAVIEFRFNVGVCSDLTG